jgi:perosamine synthetase
MDPARRYWHVVIGSNHRMDNLTAAVARAQIERWDELAAGRAKVAAAYDAALAGLNIQRRPVADWAHESVWLYTVASARRGVLLRACARRGVDARALWPALPDNPAFARYPRSDCRHARRIANEAMWLPTWSGMPADAIGLVVDAVHAGLRDAAP